MYSKFSIDGSKKGNLPFKKSESPVYALAKILYEDCFYLIKIRNTILKGDSPFKVGSTATVEPNFGPFLY